MAQLIRIPAQLPRRSQRIEYINHLWGLADKRGRLEIWRQCVQGPTRLLYKYRPVEGPFAEENLRDILLRSELRLSAVDELNDPFEVTCRMIAEGSPEAKLRRLQLAVVHRGIPPAEREAAVAKLMQCPPEYFHDECQRAFDDLRGKLGVYCFASSSKLSPMWAYYADNSHGVCLIFDCVRDFPLLTRVVPVVSVEGNDIPTLNYFGDIEDDVLKVLTRKQIGWQHEKEFRLIAFMQARKYAYVRPDAVRGIILGMNIQPRGVELVQTLMRERASARLPKLIVLQAGRHKEKLEFSIRRTKRHLNK